MDLAALKSICIIARKLAENDPDNQQLQRAYEKTQRAVQAAERVAFCDIQEPK